MSLDFRLQRKAKPSGPRVGQYHDNYVLGCGGCEISGFRRAVVEAFALLGYAMGFGSWVPKFRDGLSVP